MIEMILATDNAKHTEFLNILNATIERGNMFQEKNAIEDQITTLRVILHTADVSNVRGKYHSTFFPFYQ
jgi:hypothetical protein